MNTEVCWVVENKLQKSEVEAYLKKKQIDKEVELVYFPYRLYTYELKLKRMFFKEKRLELSILLNGVTGACNPVQFQKSELSTGYPKGRCLSYKINVDEYNSKSMDAALFYAMKHYFIVSEPELNCIGMYDVYYPFWEYDLCKYVNGRSLSLEKV